ncbi:MAG: hypothetical protein J5793_04755 [Clostridia bacterium]|nr:hypothetical protein [Clostridia bacterium]
MKKPFLLFKTPKGIASVILAVALTVFAVCAIAAIYGGNNDIAVFAGGGGNGLPRGLFDLFKEAVG